MLRRIFTSKPSAPQPAQVEDVFALLATLPQFSIARAAQRIGRECA